MAFSLSSEQHPIHSSYRASPSGTGFSFSHVLHRTRSGSNPTPLKPAIQLDDHHQPFSSQLNASCACACDDAKRKAKIGQGTFVFDASRLPVIEAHMMPFSIDYDGEAPIKFFCCLIGEFHSDELARDYFQPVAKENNLKSASFRGRELTGQMIQLPEGCVGLNMDVDRLGADWKVFPTLRLVCLILSCGDQATEQFKEVTFWSPDNSLQPDQHIRESLPLWLRISKAVQLPFTIIFVS
ncbi:hypothetical protein BVRB_024040 [Beta vulgaris subsp. vulgaris]|uniref:Uncharacterized protein n=1 Tax=Beta vulgaris subsp. vulgaris TaxID=3555 RepID=A0A0J8AZN1_BETVV|nr:hypothetical protein BVRB_024040 [Beta vulgaris subsp. vulgaris]